tara:strand:- start:157 stop:405 length:249 start_codon:yes stop_codon:yes gene_type:complete
MYRITLDKLAKRDLKKLDKNDQKRIISKIEELSTNPHLGKRLSGNLFGLWRLRFDKFRIRYRIIEDKLIIIIINIKHRKEAY